MNIKIKNVISDFDFEKLHKAMCAVGWYYRGNCHITVNELKETAIHVCEEAMENKCQYRAGGFSAWYGYEDEKLILELAFTFESSYDDK